MNCKCEKPILQKQTRICGRCGLYIDRVRHILLESEQLNKEWCE